MINTTINAVCTVYNLTKAELQSNNRTRPKPEARRMLIYILKAVKIKRKHIKQASNLKDNSISRAVVVCKYEIEIYKDIAIKYNAIVSMIIPKLKAERQAIIKWLEANPDANWTDRHDKITRLATLDNYLEHI